MNDPTDWPITEPPFRAETPSPYRPPVVVNVKRRPIYEKRQDINYEGKFAAAVMAASENLVIQKIKKRFYPCDLVIKQKSLRKVIGFVEFKRRLGALDYADGVMLSLEKFTRIMAFKLFCKVDIIFAIEHAEGEYYAAILAGANYEIVMGGRKDRGDDGDVEPVVLGAEGTVQTPFRFYRGTGDEVMSAKISIKILHRWLARHYDKDAEQAVFDLEHEIDALKNAVKKPLLEDKQETGDLRK